MVAIAGDVEASYFFRATFEHPDSVRSHLMLGLSLRHVDGRGRECHFPRFRRPIANSRDLISAGVKFLRSVQKLPQVVREPHLTPQPLHRIPSPPHICP